jgi:hypothetical protein
MRKARRMFRIELHRNAPNTGIELYTGIETNAGGTNAARPRLLSRVRQDILPRPCVLAEFWTFEAPLSPRRGFLFEDAARQ